MLKPQIVHDVPHPDPVAAIRRCADRIFAMDEAVDTTGRFPHDSIALLAEAGLLVAPLPRALGGIGLGSDPLQTAALAAVLTATGRASLAVGRLYEGHVNAIILAVRCGEAPALAILAEEAGAGRISGVWNAERAPGLRASSVAGGWQLDGGKIHCSGSGSIMRPLVTASIAPGAPPLMLIADMAAAGASVDLAVWRAAGMHGSVTGSVDFERHFVRDGAVVGTAGDYYRSPEFAGGAWRVLAVQLGALERIIALHGDFLRSSGREREPVLRGRFADAAADLELARLLVSETAGRAEAPASAPAAVVSYVDMARTAFERLALSIVAATRRNVGLSSFIAPNPLDRVLRDLETYLRQPFLDASRDNFARHLLANQGV